MFRYCRRSSATLSRGSFFLPPPLPPFFFPSFFSSFILLLDFFRYFEMLQLELSIMDMLDVLLIILVSPPVFNNSKAFKKATRN